MEVLRVNDDELRNKKLSFCTVNCEGDQLYWVEDGSLKDVLTWWNSEDFAGPANDDYVLQLIVKGHIIFDYRNEYDHGSILNDIPSFEQMLRMLEGLEMWFNEARNEDEETNPDLMADIYVAAMINGKREEWEYFCIENFFDDLNTDRLSFPKPSDEVIECKSNGRAFYPTDFAQLLSILGYKDNMKDDKSSVAVAKASVMHDKSYYLDKFKDKIAKCEEEERNNAHQEGVEYDSSFAQERFDEECNAEEIVGYYINYYEDDALKTWREAIEGRVVTDEIRDVTRILEYLYTSEPYAISPQTALTVLAANMPKDFSGFTSETESGEPEYLMDLPNGRTLKIVYQDTGDVNRYYSWQVLYSDNEFTELDYNPDDLVIAEEDVDGFDFDTVYMELDWAIRIATETPKYQPSFKVGDEVRYNGDFCYVIDVKDRGLNLFNTERRNSFSVSFEQIKEITLEGHSDMAEKVFS